MQRLNQKVIAWGVALTTLAAPVFAMADDDPPPDARLVGYKGALKTVVDSGTAGTWFVFALVVAIVVAFLFMNAKRSHLD